MNTKTRRLKRASERLARCSCVRDDVAKAIYVCSYCVPNENAFQILVVFIGAFKYPNGVKYTIKYKKM